MVATISNLIPWFFAAVLAAGIIYLVASLFLGIGAEIDLEIPELPDGTVGNAGDEAMGIGCNVIAAFCVGVGAMGLLGTLSNWNGLLTLLISLLFGLVLGRVIQKSMGFVLRQQSNDLITPDRLIGTTARITVNIPAGRIGEALLEGEERMKYPVRHVLNAPLAKGDVVVIEAVRDGRLYVRKTNS